MEEETELMTVDNIQNRVYIIRDQQVMLDFDLAEIYAKTGMTLTDAFNTFIQQSLNVEGLPFIVTKNSKEALREQAVAMLMLDLKRAEERADAEGWMEADDLERELGVLD